VIFRTDEGFASSQSEPSHGIQVKHHPRAVTEFPFSSLAKTMRSIISNMGDSILDRSPNSGTLELKEAIRRYLARSRGITAKAEQIIIGSGSEYLYGLIVNLLGRGKRYAIESPSYKKIEQVYHASDLWLEKLPLGPDGIDSASLRNCKADVLHISPYRSYPSGVTASASKRHEYLRWAAQNGRFIVEDDFESEFSLSKKAEETLFTHTSYDNVIYMNTFSMTVSPSLRVGYMVLPDSLVAAFEEKLGFYSCTVPTYIQLVLAELISGGSFERHINRVRRAKRKALKQ
jgi:GntR family transcriptional regulator/MocR family aminotransferase